MDNDDYDVVLSVTTTLGQDARLAVVLGPHALIMRQWARHVSLKRSLYVADVKLLFV